MFGGFQVVFVVGVGVEVLWFGILVEILYLKLQLWGLLEDSYWPELELAEVLGPGQKQGLEQEQGLRCVPLGI